MVGDEAVSRDGAGASPLAMVEAEGAFGDGEVRDSRRGGNSRPGVTSPRDPGPTTSGQRGGSRGSPPRNPEEKEAALDQEPPGTERGWGGVEAGRCGVCGRLSGLGALPD